MDAAHFLLQERDEQIKQNQTFEDVIKQTSARLHRGRMRLEDIEGLLAKLNKIEAPENPSKPITGSTETYMNAVSSIGDSKRLPMSDLVREILAVLPKQAGHLDEIINEASKRGYTILRPSLQAMLSRDQKVNFVPVASGTGRWTLAGSETAQEDEASPTGNSIRTMLPPEAVYPDDDDDYDDDDEDSEGNVADLDEEDSSEDEVTLPAVDDDEWFNI